MHNGTMAGLAALAASLRPAHAALVQRARVFGARIGIDLLDLRPGVDGVWHAHFRLEEDAEPAHPVRPPQAEFAAREPEGQVEALFVNGVQEFLSPVGASRPFDGDGTDDLPRFIAEADPVVRVPPRGRAGPPPRLGAEARIRMLAEVVAGDALLSVRHRELHGDPAAVEAALGHARRHYEVAIARVGACLTPAELLDRYEAACAALRTPLLAG